MKGKLVKVFVFMMFLCEFANSQSNTESITFNPTFADKQINLADSSFYLRDSSNFQIEVLKFYISKLQLLKNGKVVFTEKHGAFLIDISKPLSCKINIAKYIDFDAIQFNLGIDSTINVSGAMGGDLDPTKGMYWTWQSGYINFKLEGKNNLCKTRNHEFQFHLGGYVSPFNSLQTVKLPVKNKSKVVIDLDVKKIIENIDFKKQHSIMSTTSDAVCFSALVAKAFSIN